MQTRVLITGGAGFIGHHICEHILKNTHWDIVILDKLNYASYGWERLRDVKVYDDKRVTSFTHDLCQPIDGHLITEIGPIDYILHLGAETHVDNSITNPEPFVRSNVLGTMNILQFARTLPNLRRFFYFSTDEVFGPAPAGVSYGEWDRYNSGNPYSAAKAGGEELCLAWANSYKLPVTITHCMNVMGERQHPEKFIPKVINTVLSGSKIFIHANPEKTKAGSRFYIHARNVADAVLFLAHTEYRGCDKFNIVGEAEVDNLALAQMIAKIVGKPLNYELVDFHSSRPGHDLRYALNGGKMASLGWRPPKTFEESLRNVVTWSLANPRWLK